MQKSFFYFLTGNSYFQLWTLIILKVWQAKCLAKILFKVSIFEQIWNFAIRNSLGDKNFGQCPFLSWKAARAIWALSGISQHLKFISTSESSLRHTFLSAHKFRAAKNWFKFEQMFRILFILLTRGRQEFHHVQVASFRDFFTKLSPKNFLGKACSLNHCFVSSLHH